MDTTPVIWEHVWVGVDVKIALHEKGMELAWIPVIMLLDGDWRGRWKSSCSCQILWRLLNLCGKLVNLVNLQLGLDCHWIHVVAKVFCQGRNPHETKRVLLSPRGGFI